MIHAGSGIESVDGLNFHPFPNTDKRRAQPGLANAWSASAPPAPFPSKFQNRARSSPSLSLWTSEPPHSLFPRPFSRRRLHRATFIPSNNFLTLPFPPFHHTVHPFAPGEPNRAVLIFHPIPYHKRTMPALKYALPVLAAAGYAYADCSSTETLTIENSGQASSVASCKTYTGNIAVATGMSDDISFGQLKEIDGDLVIKNNQNVKRLDGNGLEKISGELKLQDNTQLAAVSFPKLDEVKKLTMVGLASLRSLGFDGEVSNVEDLSIENTELQNLNGINLNKSKSIRIIANKAITNISMGVTNMTGPMEIGDNNADVVVSFPNLEHASNMSFRAVGNLSLPALKDIGPGSFGIFKSKLKSFYANNFTEVKSDFTISNCTELEDLSLPALTKVGAFRIENTNLGEITKLGKLKEANAALDVSGKNLTKIETPSLDYVKGVFNVQSQSDLGNSCDAYKKLNSQNKLGPQGKFKCEGKLAQAGNAGSNGGNGGSGGNKPSDSAAAPVEMQTYLGLAGLLAVLFV